MDGEGGVEGLGLAPKAQVIITGCWLTMKEVSLLMGALARYTPLPGGACACLLVAVLGYCSLGQQSWAACCHELGLCLSSW